MASNETPSGFGDLFAALGGANLLAPLARTAEQFRAGVVGFIEAVAAFKQTMDALGATTIRLNRMLDQIEGPLQVLMPQITATSEQAARVMAIMSGPVERMGPGLAQLADTLSSPTVADLPRRLNDVVEAMSALPRTLTPLNQVAEMAGGIFGSGLRTLGGLGGLSGLGQQSGGRRPTRAASTGAAATDTRWRGATTTAGASAGASVPTGAPAASAVAKKVPARSAAAKDASAKHATAASTRKGATKRSTARTAGAKRGGTAKASARKRSTTTTAKRAAGGTAAR